MAASNTIDLAGLELRPGEARQLELPVHPEGLTYAGRDYVPSGVPASLDVSRMAGGYALRLRFETELAGECMRCLADSRIPVSVDAREIDQPGGGEELESPYVQEGVLQLTRWAHDALALALPVRLLCREDCAGLCLVCGESMNDAAPGAHDHAAEPDPRWAKLRELKLD